MSSFFQGLLSDLLLYRYATLFLINFLSCIGFPLPAAPSTIAAAAFASQGFLDMKLVLLSAISGNILGDIAAYWLVRLCGPRVLHWIGLGKYLTTPAFRNVEKTVDTYKAPVLIASRFQVQATAVVNIISGLARLHFKRFAFYIVIGEMLQVIVYVVVGYTFADSWQALYAVVGKFGWLVALTMAIAITMASNKVIKRMLK